MSEACEAGCLNPSTVLNHSFSTIEELRSQSHVAQQSRRDKLRVQQLHNSSANPGIGAVTATALMPLYDPTILSSEMLTFVTGNEIFVKDERAGFQNNPLQISHSGAVHSESNSDLILNYGGSNPGFVTQNPFLGPMVVGGFLASTLKQPHFSSSSSSSACTSSSSQLYLMNPNFTEPPNPPQSSLNFHGFSQHPLAVENPSLYTAQVPQNLREPPSQGFNLPHIGSLHNSQSVYHRFSNLSEESYNGEDEYKQEPVALRQDSTGQGLSLSLSFQNPPPELHLQQYEARFDYQSLAHGTGTFSVDEKAAKPEDLYSRQFIERNYGDGGGKGFSGMVHGLGVSSSSSNEIQKNLVPLGPFTGYATVLKSSRFLKPTQQLLDDFCNVGHGVHAEMLKPQPSGSHETLLERTSGGGGGSFDTNPRVSNPCVVAFSSSPSIFPLTSMETRNEPGIDDPLPTGDRGEHQKKKMRLMSMLDEVCRRDIHYYEQMQIVITSFESVEGLRSVAPYTSLALKSMSKHFRSLKNAIADQLRFVSKALGDDCHNKEEIPRLRLVDHQRAASRPGLLGQQHVWRPQRGLPERAVAVLRTWLFEHFLHPYPNDADKQMLAKQTGLSRSQVSNWFINARVRLWKPMVEEMHMLETREASATAPSAMDLNNTIKKPDTPSEETTNERKKQQAKMTIEVLSDKHQPQQQESCDQPLKRSRNELPHMINNNESMDFSYENLASPDGHVGVRVSALGNNSGGGGVSLTLGLHHNGVQEKYHHNNNGMLLSMSQTDPSLPVKGAHHFSSLQQNNDNSQAFGIGGFVEPQQSLQLRNQISCQLLRDFTG